MCARVAKGISRRVQLEGGPNKGNCDDLASIQAFWCAIWPTALVKVSQRSGSGSGNGVGGSMCEKIAGEGGCGVS